MIRTKQEAVSRRQNIVIVALVFALATIWILGVAPSAGPDEPAHLVRSGAVVRGQLTGERFAGQGRAFDLPAWIGHPGHECFALLEQQPASCATAEPRPASSALLTTTAWEYPIWGHVAPGLGTLFPAPFGNQAARLLDALIPIGLIFAGLTLARRRGPESLAGALLAVTPMAWFSIIVVNPSGLVISGGFALWTGFLSIATLSTNRSHSGKTDTALVTKADWVVRWTIAAGWAATVLPRRDGLIWATLILGICTALGVVSLQSLKRQLGVGPLLLVGLSTVATLTWAAISDSSSSNLLFAAPAVPVLGAGASRLWSSDRLSRAGWRLIFGLSGSALAGLLAHTALSSRKGRFDTELFQLVVNQTGLNLEEAIGLLGSLDTPLPRVALFLWLVALGVVVSATFRCCENRRSMISIVVVAVAVTSSWVLEMNQGSAQGVYWQGRYYLPLLVGVPIVLSWPMAGKSSGITDYSQEAMVRMSFVMGASLLVTTLAYSAALRRWGVGTAGSLNPAAWDTYGTVVPPWVLLVAHALVALALLRLTRSCIRADQIARSG